MRNGSSIVFIWQGLTEAFEDENYFPGAFQVLGEKIAVAKGNSPPGA
jgi:hypothetical protein